MGSAIGLMMPRGVLMTHSIALECIAFIAVINKPLDIEVMEPLELISTSCRLAHTMCISADV